MNIREFKVGETVRPTLLVKKAEIKFTKPPGNKPYLSVDLTDGMDVIAGVDWDWGNVPAPERNTVMDVVAQVTEWSGTKQLKLLRLSPNADIGIEQFAPKGDVDIDDYWQRAGEMVEAMNNKHARDIVRRAFLENEQLWRVIPAAKGIHHAFVGGNLKHAVDVARKANAMASVMPWVNRDLCVAGGLLQDFGKLWTYTLDGAIIDMSDDGRMVEHIAIGIAKLEAYRTPENSKVLSLIQHLVASHHGQIEYGSPTTPLCIEALIVATADSLDSRSQTIYEANAKKTPADKYTDKVFTMNNRELLTQFYIDEIMGQ